MSVKQPGRRRRKPPAIAIFFFASFAAIIGLAAYLGKLAPTYLPLPQLDLTRPDAWALDWRLAQLSTDASLCRATLAPSLIEITAIPDRQTTDGCGWGNAVTVATVAGARADVDELTCPMTAALTLWMTHVVQPAAREAFGHPVTAVRHLGAYACRNINGNPAWRHTRSQHATANALDIAGFTLANGQTITVLKDWPTSSDKASFLRRIHSGACRYFRVVLGPDYNAAHKNHFHLDRGAYRSCR